MSGEFCRAVPACIISGLAHERCWIDRGLWGLEGSRGVFVETSWEPPAVFLNLTFENPPGPSSSISSRGVFQTPPGPGRLKCQHMNPPRDPLAPKKLPWGFTPPGPSSSIDPSPLRGVLYLRETLISSSAHLIKSHLVKRSAHQAHLIKCSSHQVSSRQVSAHQVVFAHLIKSHLVNF